MTDTVHSQTEATQQDLLNLPMHVPVLTRKYDADALVRETSQKPRITTDELENYLHNQQRQSEPDSPAADPTLRVPPNAVVLTDQDLAELETAIDQRVQRLLDRSLERTVEDLQVVIKTQLQQRIQALLPNMIARAVNDELNKIYSEQLGK